jgi:hypothetical protein
MCAAAHARHRLLVHYPPPISKTKMDKRILFYFMGVDAVRQPLWGGCRTGGCLGFFRGRKAKHPTL